MRHWLKSHRIILVLGIGLIFFIKAISAAELSSLTVVTSSGKMFGFNIEIVDTPDERRQGLMGRETLADDAGMLFIFDDEKKRSFWMKNTPLSLDILFFDKNGQYVSHHAEAVPHSLNSIKSGGPAKYVLEINAGLTEALGIGRMSRILLP
jgi:uncharacterized membrane protein (UPF0127 family)